MNRREDLPEELFDTPRAFIRGAIGGGLIWLGLAIIGWRFVVGVL